MKIELLSRNKEKIIKLIKYGALSCFVILTLLMAYVNRHSDYYEWIVMEHDIRDEYNKGGAKFAIDRGDYQVTVTYDTTSDTAACDIYNGCYTDSTNTQGKVIAKQNLPPELHEVTFPLHIDEFNRRIYLRPLCEEGELTIRHIEIRSNYLFYTDSLFLLICFWSILLMVRYYFKKNKQADLIVITTILVLTLLTTLPYCTDFLLRGDDLQFHLARIEGIYRSLRADQFPVRINILQGNEYGYATPIMYPDIFLYIPALLRFTGISLGLAFKLFIVIVNLSTAILSYLSFKGIVHSKYAALAGSMLYTLCTYRLIDLYIREAVGEYLAMLFIPLIVWGMYEIFVGNYKYWMLAVIGYTGVLQSHILSFFMVTVFSFLFTICLGYHLIRCRERVWALIKAMMITILLNLWFIIPLLSYSSLDFPALKNAAANDLHIHSLYLSQMFSMFQKIEDPNDSLPLGIMQGEMPLSVGMGLLVGVCIFIGAWLRLRDRKRDQGVKRELSIGWVAFAFGALSLFMTSCLFPWEAIRQYPVIYRIFASVQFPWRWLTITSISFSITSMIGIHLLLLRQDTNLHETTRMEYVMYSVLLLALLTSLFLIEGTSQLGGMSRKAELEGIDYTDGLYYYQNTDIQQWDERGNVITSSPDAHITISNYSKRGNHIKATMQSNSRTKDSYVELPLAYYPDYVATMNGHPIEVTRGNNNIVRVPITEPMGNLEVQFKERPSWILANAISLLTLFLILLTHIKHLQMPGTMNRKRLP